MKNFLKNVLSSTIGVFLFSFISLIIIIFAILIPLLKSDSTPKLKENSILEISLKQNIIESSFEEQIDFMSFEESNSLYLKDILDAIKNAKTDENIKGITLKLSYFNAGITQTEEIRNALLDFKKSRKFIYAYLNNSTQKSYYLASISDKIYQNPTGMTELFGLSSEVFFFKDLGEKYGINFNVIRHGEYKSAVEPFIRNSISDENKQQISELLSGIWNEISKDISISRKIPIDQLNKIVNNLESFMPESALKNKLIDGLMQESQFDNTIKTKLGIKESDEKINSISLKNYINHSQSLNLKDESIAILYASGEIYNGDKTENIHSENFKKIIQEIKEDNTIKALVLRVNSPGGSANASDEILYELQELKKKKPIVVSFGDVAASGGYYISMVADSIFAYKTTITGSIGVLGMIPDIKKLANNQGINSEIVQTNTNSYFYSPTYGISEGAQNMMKLSVESTYNRFVNFVAKNRKKTFSQIDSLGKGRVWIGEKALQNGLIDKIGTLNQAINSAGKLAKIKEYNLVTYPKKENAFEKFINNFKKSPEIKVQTIIKNELGEEEYKIYQKIKSLKSQKGIIMLAPFEVKF